MPVTGPIIRPPSEAHSFLLQITTGCSSNRCSFCGAYIGKPFRIKSFSEIKSDIQQYAMHYPQTKRVFLLDGDALVCKTAFLLQVFKELHSTFPELRRISSYVNDYNILNKTDEELKLLYEYKLRLIYMGLESGSQKVLSSCNKKSTVNGMITVIKRAKIAGISESVIVLLGLGGKKLSSEHCEQTALVLNQMQPRYLSFLSLMILPQTSLHKEMLKGDFKPLSGKEHLKEAYDIISKVHLTRTIFRANHASNYLSLSGKLPRDKDRILEEISNVIDGKSELRPDYLRGL